MQPESRHIYLRKANDDLISFCMCDKAEALISEPGQMDCPWCGCGWLFTCMKCRKAFTFAEGFEVGKSWEDLADRDIRGFYEHAPEPRETQAWTASMKSLLQDAQVGEQYVYFDGHVIPRSAESVHFVGWNSKHELGFLPHVAALEDPEILDGLLRSVDYWLDTEVHINGSLV